MRKESTWFQVKQKLIKIFLTQTSKNILKTILVLAALIYTLSGLCLTAFFVYSSFTVEKLADQVEIFRNIGLAFAAFLGAPFVIWRSVIAQNQAMTAAEGLITDRYTKAVDQLGAVKSVPMTENVCDKEKNVLRWEEEMPNLEVRIGGLSALERISYDCKRDHIPIMETICAYLRINSKCQKEDHHGQNSEEYGEQRPDINHALRVLKDRSKESSKFELKQRYYLILVDTILQKSDLRDGNLRSADLDGADLRYSNLRRLDLSDASLVSVNFQYADISDCKFERSSLRGANFSNTIGFDISMIANAHGVREGYGKTILPRGIEHPKDWFIAKDAEKDTNDLVNAYYNDLKIWYKKF